MSKDKFKSYYQIIKLNIDEAIESYYTYMSIYDIIDSDEEVAKKINKNSNFWFLVLGSLQQSFIMALARIFDDVKNTISIHKLIKYCEKNPSIFPKESFQQNFKIIRKELTGIRRLYDGCKFDKSKPSYTLKRIRSGILAHSITVTLDQIHDLYTEVNFTDIHYILINLYDFLEVMLKFYEEGIEPKFGLTNKDFETPIKQTTEKFLSSLV